MNDTEQLEICVENVLMEMNLSDLVTLNKIRRYWVEVVGAAIAKKTYPHKIERKKLIIACDDPIYSNQILMCYQKNIIDYVRVVAEKDLINKIGFIVKNVDAIKEKEQSKIKKAEKLPPLSVEQEKQINEISNQITHLKSKKRFKSWYRQKVISASEQKQK